MDFGVDDSGCLYLGCILRDSAANNIEYSQHKDVSNHILLYLNKSLLD